MSQAEVKQPVPSDQSTKDKLKASFRFGIKKGWHGFLWMAKIIVPMSLAIALLKWSGWLYKADAFLAPAMNLINLPSEAALPLLSGFVINIYAVLAILLIVPFSIGQATLITVFGLVAHNLIQEGIIQHKSGINAFKIIGIRLVAAVALMFIMAPFLGDTRQSVISTLTVTQVPFTDAMLTWLKDTGLMLLKIFGIIMAIMILLEGLSRMGWDVYLHRVFRPLMRVFGLSDSSAMLWVTAVVFGLSYGGAVILGKIKENALTHSEVERLHISVGINHSIIKDTGLFMALGISAFWLVVPKLVVSIIAVQIYRLIEFFKRKPRATPA